MERPRLVHFITILQHGGAERVLFHLLDDLKEQFEQSVIYIYAGPGVAEVATRNIPHYHIGSIGGIINPLTWYRLIRVLQGLKPHLLHTMLWSAQIMGLLCAQLLRSHAITSVHLSAECTGKIRTFLERLLPYRYTRIITTAHSIEQSLISHKLYHPTQIFTIQNGLDEHDFRIRAANKIPSLSFGKQQYYIIGTVGRLVPVKNQHLLIIAFAQIQHLFPHTRLMIVGSGPEEDKLRILAHKQGVHEQVIFITGQDAAPYYRYFDCFVLPSAREGGMSYALLEALASHLCPIVTGTLPNHLHELITDGYNGIVIPPNNVSALYNALYTVITDHKLITRYKAAGKTTIAQQSSHKMVQRYGTLFRSIIEQPIIKDGSPS